MGGIVGKVWGTTEVLLKTPFIEIHLLKILPHSKCSLHCHNHKHNAFVVISGALRIETAKNDYQLTDITPLGPGDLTTVKPLEYHRFVSGDTEVLALEMYYPEGISEDIVRKNCGSTGMQVNERKKAPDGTAKGTDKSVARQRVPR